MTGTGSPQHAQLSAGHDRQALWVCQIGIATACSLRAKKGLEMALRGCLKICLPPVFQVYFAAMSGQNERKSYPTDLTDAEWQRIAPYLPERKS